LTQVNDARKDAERDTRQRTIDLAALLGDYSWQLAEVPIGAGLHDLRILRERGPTHSQAV
jgi:hypothetical protein